MAKLYTRVGYAPSFEQTAPGVWEEVEVLKRYYADVIRNSRHLESSGHVNDSVSVSNKISIISDPYARENFHSMRWVEYMGSKWHVTDVEVEYPRLILTLGGLFNENTASEDTAENGTAVSA